MSIQKIDAKIKAICPIHGVSFGDEYRIDFKEEATEEQRSAADVLLASLTTPEALALEAQESAKEAIRQQIRDIEEEQLIPRGLREFLLLQLPQIAQSGGVTEAQLYLANPFYKKLKDVNAQIVALRAQL